MKAHPHVCGGSPLTRICCRDVAALSSTYCFPGFSAITFLAQVVLPHPAARPGMSGQHSGSRPTNTCSIAMDTLGQLGLLEPRAAAVLDQVCGRYGICTG